MSDPIQLIQDRHGKATKGPWTVFRTMGSDVVYSDADARVCRLYRSAVNPNSQADADFIAHAWEDIRTLLAEREALQTWQPIETCPAQITRAILFWPTFALDGNFEQTTERTGDGLVAEGFRVGRNAWECDIVTEHFEDEAGFGYGEPTHWRPHPYPPSTAAQLLPDETRKA